MVRNLIDIVSEEKRHITERLGENFLGLLLYGSFSYQNLHSKITSFSDVSSLLDKKPDYIAIVKDSYAAVRSLLDPAERTMTKMKKRDRLLGFPSSPLYVNSETDEHYRLATEQEVSEHPLPYKIGLLEQVDFEKSVDDDISVIYHQLRLSKPFNIVASSPHYRERLCHTIEDIRDRIFTEAVLDAMDVRDMDELIYLYANTYRFESYRFFDTLSIGKNKNKKVDRILDATFFNMEDDIYIVTMREEISKYVSKRTVFPRMTLQSRNDSIPSESYPSSHPFKWDGSYTTERSLFPYTIACLKCSIRNGFSNGLFGAQSNMNYLARKLGFLNGKTKRE